MTGFSGRKRADTCSRGLIDSKQARITKCVAANGTGGRPRCCSNDVSLNLLIYGRSLFCVIIFFLLGCYFIFFFSLFFFFFVLFFGFFDDEMALNDVNHEAVHRSTSDEKSVSLRRRLKGE